MSDSNDIAIKVSHVSKNFKLPHEPQKSIKSSIINFHKRGYEVQHALRDVSFEVKKGEFFGIVGRNGSGKSTLLKILSGIYAPTSGNVTVNGKLTPFIELGVGFNPELTGRDNVFLNGALLGFSRKEMLEMYDEIVEFAEIERFMDQKLKNYSSGMQVRLAFSIAIRANTDILVLDEVLAVGDAAFQQKCFEYFGKLKEQNKTIILVTHDMGSVKRFCDRAILIKDGIVEIDGDPDDIASQYVFENFKNDDAIFDEMNNTQLTDKVERLNLEFKSETDISTDESLIFDIEYKLLINTPVYLGLTILYQGISVFEQNSIGLDIGHEKGKVYKIRYTLPLNVYQTAPLSVNVSLFDKKSKEPIGHINNSRKFFVRGEASKTKGGLINTEGSWKNV